MKPVEYINELKKHYANTDIDWELILENGYRLFLDPSSVVIDIGGHAGRHTAIFVNQIGCKRILVFEPLPHQFAFLCDRYQAQPGVEIFNLALGAEAGRVDFVFNLNSPEESGLRERYYNDPEGKNLEILTVEAATLDGLDLGLERLDYVKIDTEGGEVDILLGASQTIHRHRPILSVEYGLAGYGAYGKTRSTLYELATEMSYGIFDLFGHPIATAEDWDECADNYYWDFYLVPDEGAGSFSERLAGRIFESVPNCLAASAPGTRLGSE
jgi:FkbM family methyltransferase